MFPVFVLKHVNETRIKNNTFATHVFFGNLSLLYRKVKHMCHSLQLMFRTEKNIFFIEHVCK